MIWIGGADLGARTPAYGHCMLLAPKKCYILKYGNENAKRSCS